MLTVHHLGISQSDRAVWLCEELGIPYELKLYERDPVTRLAPPSYKAVSPSGTAPVITDGETVLGESAAILEYLIEIHGGGRLALHPGDKGYADYLFWFHFANGSFMPAAMADMLVHSGLEDTGLLHMLRTRLDRAYDMTEARLGTQPYLAGDAFTAADIMTAFPLTTMRVFAPRDLAPYPNIRAYLQRIATRPAYRKAMAKADPGFEPPLS